MTPLAMLIKVLAPLFVLWLIGLRLCARYSPSERRVRALARAVRQHGPRSPEARLAFAELEAYKRSLI